MMILTGKAKELLNDWLIKDYPIQDVEIKWFTALDDSLKWGVYQDFALSLGYELYISRESPVQFFWCVSDLLTVISEKENEDMTLSNDNARKACINALNNIINNK